MAGLPSDTAVDCQACRTRQLIWPYLRWRVAASILLLACGWFADVDWLEGLWARIDASLDQRYKYVFDASDYDADGCVDGPHHVLADFESSRIALYRNGLLTYNTWCTGFALILGALPLLVRRLTPIEILRAAVLAVLGVSAANFARLYLIYRLVLLDVPYEIAHDVPSYIIWLTCPLLALWYCVHYARIAGRHASQIGGDLDD